MSEPTSGNAQQGAGGGAGIVIVGFPQTLYTRTFGDPDVLFVPLLEATREACKVLERLCGHGEARANAVTLSGMQLASSLLRDSSFSLVAVALTHENTYTIDVAAGTLHMLTRLYAVVSRRTSFFKVEIAGKVTGGVFVVRNPVQGTVIMQVEEDRFRQSHFFSTTLAQECLRTQMQQERFGVAEETHGAESNGEIRVVLTVSGAKVPITLRQKEAAGPWDITDGRKQEWVGILSDEMQVKLQSVTGFLQELFAHN
jgi:hypothetical protein